MSRETVRVPLAAAPYEILVEPGLLDRAGEALAPVLPPRSAAAAAAAAATPGARARRLMLVTDENVAPLYLERLAGALARAGYETRAAVLPPGEGEKSLERAAWLYRRFAEAALDREDAVLALGGGVVGDLAGFAAATYLRGIALVQAPTTLLAQVDSSVGGKTGVDLERGKNLVGAFHQPRRVLVDPQVLATLPAREYRAGLAEVVKYGVILDAELFARLERETAALARREESLLTEIVARSCALKAGIVAADERETLGRRELLNFGHTFGHALEAEAAGWGLRHGEALAVGMLLAARLAEPLTGFRETARLEQLLAALGLPTGAPGLAALGCGAWNVERLLARMAADKKARAGKLRFVLPVRLGEVKISDAYDPEAVRALLRESLVPPPAAAGPAAKPRRARQSSQSRRSPAPR